MKYKFTVVLNNGKEGIVYYNSDSFYDAQLRSEGMIKDLERRRGQTVIKASLEHVEKKINNIPVRRP